MGLDTVSMRSFELLPQLLVYLLAYTGIFILGVIIYRLFFHPLAKYPGPFLAKITDLYQAYHCYVGTKPYEISRLHQIYGEYVRFGPNTIIINTDKALHTIFSNKANVEKSNYYLGFTPFKNAFSLFSCIDKAVHARKRRVISYAFSENALRNMNEFIVRNVEVFQAALPSPDNPTEWGPARNMARLCGYLTFNVMCNVVFAHEPSPQLETKEGEEVLEGIANAAKLANVTGVMSSWIKLGLDRIMFFHLFRGRKQFFNFSRNISDARVKHNDSVARKDIFHYIISATDPETGEGLHPKERMAESNLLIVAGSDTTSIALAGTFYYLTDHPTILAKLEKEILSTWSSVDEIVHDPTLYNCRYLRACLDEALRMSPSIPGILPRHVLSGGITIDDQYFPPGVIVSTGIYSLHHNDTYYPSPKRYWPERWLEGEDGVTEEDLERAQNAFHPFSIGPRGCIGKRLAYNEMLTTLARTIWRFEMKREEGSTRGCTPDGMEYKLEDTFTSFSDGPMVQFRLRKRE